MADDRDDGGKGSAAPGEAPDLDALARRYLDLWEDQLRQLSSDPEVARAMARTIELMNTGAAAFAGMMQAGMPPAGASGAAAEPGEQGDDRSADGPDRTGGGAAGTAAAGDAPRGADVGVDDLRKRVAALERRIADLEAGLGVQGGRARGRTGGGRS